ncbi:PEP-CTERM sorting domain-containing protein [Neptunicella sp. SCSIO 80796]|uniref:PEP-CTERM sorting domain-containing protein n=1 Tax=Neptunicella plasticusilytica TaxID=3117012 RepID=UPI003A4D5B91
MKATTKILACLCIFASSLSHAAVIANGDFQSCNFNGWQKDTDGNGDPGSTNDFNMLNNAGECQAEISLDFTRGASAFVANSLFTELDLTVAADQQLQLSFDWDFSGFDDQTISADLFSVILTNDLNFPTAADGNPGFLIDSTAIYASGSFSAMLDSSFNNQSGWFLNFILEGGFNPGSFSSSLLIDNVALTVVSNDVPEPPVTAMLLLGFTALIARRRSSNTDKLL